MIPKLIDPENAYKVYTQFGVPKVRACTMYGGYCPMILVMEQIKKLETTGGVQ